jgi:hypothetical protein
MDLSLRNLTVPGRVVPNGFGILPSGRAGNQTSRRLNSDKGPAFTIRESASVGSSRPLPREALSALSARQIPGRTNSHRLNRRIDTTRPTPVLARRFQSSSARYRESGEYGAAFWADLPGVPLSQHCERQNEWPHGIVSSILR